MIVGVGVGVVTVPLRVIDFTNPVFQYRRNIFELIDDPDGVYLNKIHLDSFEPRLYGKSLLVKQSVEALPVWMIKGFVAPTVEKNMEFIVIGEVPMLSMVTSDVISVPTGTLPKLI